MNKNNRTGFTLIEIIVAVAIFVIIGSVGLLSFVRNRQSSDLSRSASELASNIRKAQGYSRSGRNEAGVVPRAYGVSIDIESHPGTYYLYADSDSEIPEAYCYECVADDDILIGEYTLATNTEISDLAIEGFSPTEDLKRVDFIFFIPSMEMKVVYLDPDTGVYTLFSPAGTSKITLEVSHTQVGDTKSLIVEGGVLGGVTIEDTP